jgi:hypothetical protein
LLYKGEVIVRRGFADSVTQPRYEKCLQQRWEAHGTKGTTLVDWRDVEEVDVNPEPKEETTNE